MPSFPRTARLLGADDFQRVFAQPIRFGDRLVTVLARTNGRAGPRLGLAVSRRRIAGAVARNRFRRIVRESFRARRDRLGGYDVVVLPKPPAAAASKDELRASIDRQWALLERRAAGRNGPAGGPEQ